jgi:hypothetical protein
VFITIWLLGDFFNIFGAVLQGVLPTMIILAVYYTLADVVLLLQCFWYKGFTLKDEVKKPLVNGTGGGSSDDASEESPLLGNSVGSYSNGNGNTAAPRISDIDRRSSVHSQTSLRDRLLSIDGSHLSPVTPLLSDSYFNDNHHRPTTPTPRPQQPSQTTIQTILFNAGAILLVILSGILGWYLSASRRDPEDPSTPHNDDATLHFNLWGQISGYICALLYLGSRVPQLLLNYRRKSTEGISMLFFLFACIGNLTYVLSILAYKPRCWGDGDGRCGGREARSVYWRYMAVNASWLLGSFGTLLLDACVFVQYFLYRMDGEGEMGV